MAGRGGRRLFPRCDDDRSPTDRPGPLRRAGARLCRAALGAACRWTPNRRTPRPFGRDGEVWSGSCPPPTTRTDSRRPLPDVQPVQGIRGAIGSNRRAEGPTPGDGCRCSRPSPCKANPAGETSRMHGGQLRGGSPSASSGRQRPACTVQGTRGAFPQERSGGEDSIAQPRGSTTRPMK